MKEMNSHQELDNILGENKTLLIFDMDGTILDSMTLWQNLGQKYLESKAKVAEEGLQDIIDNMTLQESANYLKTEYNLEEDKNTIIKEILDFIEYKYLNEIPLKKGAKQYLEKVHAEGYKMCVLTTSEKKQALGALKRTGILDLFYEVYTDKDFEMSKREPQIYLKTCEKMNESPSNTVVFEDSLYAVESAKKAGCIVIGVYDDYSKKDWNKIKSIADFFI